MWLYKYMRAGQEFIDFPVEDLPIHLNRVTRRLEPTDKRRILRVPLIFRRGGMVLLQDMRNTLAGNESGASRNACLNFPYLTFKPKQIRAFDLNFTSLLSDGVFMPKGITQIPEIEQQKVEKTIKPLLVYKDYPLSRMGEDTTVTVIPASVQFSTKKPEPPILHDFRVFHGETEWVSIIDAVRMLEEQTVEDPCNNIASDAAAIVNLAAVRVFNVPLVGGA